MARLSKNRASASALASSSGRPPAIRLKPGRSGLVAGSFIHTEYVSMSLLWAVSYFCLELLLDEVVLGLNPCYLRRAENGHEVSTEQNLHFDSSGSGSNLSARIPSSTSLNCSVMSSLVQSLSLYGTVGFPARPIQ